MKIPINIPAKKIDFEIENIVIYPKDKRVKLNIRKDGSRISKNISLMNIYNLGNNIQKQTIRHFIRSIVAKGLDVNLSDIPDDIFN